MFDISIIIFAAALIAIIAMFVAQYRRLKASGTLDRDLPARDFSYENFLLLSRKLRKFSLAVTHGSAIIATKLWVRAAHYVSRFFRKGLKKVEARLMKLEKKSEGSPGGQSVFLTTIKTYKHEVKKLQGRAEEELPRPRPEVANLENSDNIDESKPE